MATTLKIFKARATSSLLFWMVAYRIANAFKRIGRLKPVPKCTLNRFCPELPNLQLQQCRHMAFGMIYLGGIDVGRSRTLNTDHCLKTHKSKI